MKEEEFEKVRRFLDSENIPTSKDILKLFFTGGEKANLITDVKEFEAINFETLGEADDIKTFSGTEWIVSRLLWHTPEGTICTVNLIKRGQLITNYEDKEIIDISHEEVPPLPFKEQLALAIEVENFEEASRLRDWDRGLKNLLLALKPKIIDALKKEDVKRLDEYLSEIRTYRATL